ncbi:uncharacterized protein LOC135224752 [Macrobrachium nipponense]|uniref:uncharacterized protein LOC135224752 n=1 Tax=Macrobrachium nipponense TaxID=159736 RepID=UPI0030C89E1E
MKNESTNHIASEFLALAHNQYKKRHDSVAKALHWSLCKKRQLPCSNNWQKHQAEVLTENDQAKNLWDYGTAIWTVDYGIRTDRVIRANRPDVTLIDKTKKKVSPIKERVKTDKYQDLKIWDMLVEIVLPIVIGTLGTIPRSLKRNLEKLDAEVAPGLAQECALLETANTVRKVI